MRRDNGKGIRWWLLETLESRGYRLLRPCCCAAWAVLLRCLGPAAVLLHYSGMETQHTQTPLVSNSSSCLVGTSRPLLALTASSAYYPQRPHPQPLASKLVQKGSSLAAGWTVCCAAAGPAHESFSMRRLGSTAVRC